jgi:predicted metal-dependent phosphoesterase TrpH/glycosyltransferase involved in cell wall biosynthesis
MKVARPRAGQSFRPGGGIYAGAVSGATSERLTIAHVTPYTWGEHHEVNDYVADAAIDLAARGHRVIVAAPGGSLAAGKGSTSAIAAAAERPEALFGAEWKGERVGGDGPPLLRIGQAIPLPGGSRPRPAPVPVDISRSLESLLSTVDFDIVHVHDPFAPSAASAALRHSRTLNAGTFHLPTERVLSTQVARPLVEIFFGRLDARTVSGPATEDLLRRFFPGTYEVVLPSATLPGRTRPAGSPPRIAYVAREERGALRLVLRALRRLPLDLDWEADVLIEDPAIADPRINRKLRERVRFLRPADADAETVIADADIVCAATGGPRPAPGLIARSFAAAAVPVVSEIDVYEQLVGDDAGLIFPPGDTITFAGQLERLIRRPEMRAAMSKASAAHARTRAELGDQLEAIYTGLSARRHDPGGNAEVRKRISSRPTIECDLHMHTDHSNDCATPVEVLVETAKDRGMGAIAVTDHNEISGALLAREYAEKVGGIKVIVAEEVKTAEQGEVIGLFIEEKIPKGMTMAETIAEIRRQGGLVYVPHPFDRLHSVPDYEHLLDIVEDIDIIEVFNPRVAFGAFNEEAGRFAAKYRIVPGAGSDGHVAQALGSVRIRLHDFDGPEEFLEAMRSADIVRKHKNLVYVQALKWMQAASGQAGGRKEVSDPKPVQGGSRGDGKKARQRRRPVGARRGKS